MNDEPTNTPADVRDPTAVRDVLGVFVVACGLTWLIVALGQHSPWDDYVQLGVGAVFLFGAIELAQRRPGGVAGCGLALGGLLEAPPEPPTGVFGSVVDLVRSLMRAAPVAMRETAAALFVGALIFPPFVLGFYLWHAPTHGFQFALPNAAGNVLAQIVVTALPEEALFRGYLQSRLHDRFPRRVRMLGAQLSPHALVAQAVLFALIHVVVDPVPARLAVFFPGLLFGWLRAWRGGIGAAVAMHALSNLLSDVLVRGWL